MEAIVISLYFLLVSVVGLLSTSKLAPNSYIRMRLGSHIDGLEKVIQQCVNISHEKYTNGTVYYSNPKPQMGTWIDQDQFKLVLKFLNASTLSNQSPTLECLLNHQVPTYTQVLVSDLFYVTLFQTPPNQRIPERYHDPGTMLIYKPLFGFGKLIASLSGRIIQSDSFDVHKDCADKMYDYNNLKPANAITRIGGPDRIFVNNNALPSIFLEVGILPPSSTGFDRSSINESGLEHSLQFTNTSYHLQCLQLNQDELAVLIRDRNLAVPSDLSQPNSFQETQKGFKRDITRNLKSRIGGLDAQLDIISRRVLSTRKLSPELMLLLGISHVRGILLYGAPGTGKTLIAREISKRLNARPPKIVNGPEILDKYIGEAERNIRDLFKDADDEWDRYGLKSELHVIILDEFDSIAKKRGVLVGDGSGVRDSVVNQLLSKIDGIQERNNVLLIGLTNRKDLIDSALLRPGRFEVHIEIPVPDAYGRREILTILFEPMIQQAIVKESQATDWIVQIVERTADWTGADLAGLMRSASSFAIDRSFDRITGSFSRTTDQAEQQMNAAPFFLIWKDIEDALSEMSASKYDVSGSGRVKRLLSSCRSIARKIAQRLSFRKH